jgi:hypothetical protein
VLSGGGFIGLELRNPAKREEEVQKGLKIGKYFQSLGANYSIAANSGDPRRIQEAGRVDPAAGTAPQWESHAGQDRLPGGLNERHRNKAVLDELVHLVFQRGRF